MGSKQTENSTEIAHIKDEIQLFRLTYLGEIIKYKKKLT